MSWLGIGEGGAICSPVNKSQSFNEPVLLMCKLVSSPDLGGSEWPELAGVGYFSFLLSVRL